MTTSSANNSVFRGFFEKQKLTGPNFIDWYRYLRIVLSIDDKLNYLEQPISLAPVAPVGQKVAPEILAAHTAWIKGSKKIDRLMLMTMEPEIQRNLENLHAHEMLLELKTLLGKTINELHAMLKLHEQILPKNNAPALHAIQADKVQKMNNHKKPQPQMAARGQNHRKGKNQLAYAPRPKIPSSSKREDPAKDSICHVCGETGHWKRNCPQYLAELLKKKKKHSFGSWWFRDEYTSQDFLYHLKDHRIIAHRTPPYTPQHNGYLKETIGYYFYYPPENKVLVARNAEFLKNSLITQEASGSLEDLEIIQEEDTHPSIDTSLNHEEDYQEINEPQSDIVPIRRSTRARHAPDCICLYIDAESGYVFVLNGGAVDWKSAKQSIFATSSVEAEYIAAFDDSKEAVWVRKFISGLGVVPTIEEPIIMYCDNTGAIAIANESGITKGARYFHAKVHYFREVIEYGDVKLEKVHTDDNLADPFY
uniref:Zinc finger, CCHC-type n=1 Tax=Tanacetum cinerariifolium TaxID=118510 RepID=A0A699GSP3_TANCI|nr:zinc finger, CCHC-type [Tanacetum cinerariifolium]